MKPKHFLSFLAIFLILFFLFYIGLFYYQLNTNPNTTHLSFTKKFYKLKDNRIKEIGDNNKIIILSGSNSHLSINSELIEKRFNLSVVNLAYWIDNDLNFYYYQLKDILKPGDIVIMPLEFPYYYRESMTKNFMNEMMIWGEEIYINKLSYYDLLTFIISVEPKRILDGVFTRIHNKKGYKTISYQEIDKISKKLFKDGNIEINKETIITKRGDIIIDSYYQDTKLTGYIKKQKVSDYFLQKFHKIEDLISKNGAKLILTYPVTIRSEKFDLNKKKFQNQIDDFEKNLRNNNIKISCNAGLSNIDRLFCFNSPNHLTKYGREIRTKNLLSCLDKIINNNDNNISFTEALKMTKVLEIEYKDSVKPTPIHYYKTRYKDLLNIKDALHKYYLDHGSYPKSKGFDGLYTNWGMQSKHWIKNLSPKYIHELPRDPRNTTNPGNQYLYKSNGKDYKLISHHPEDCNLVRKEKPDFIDKKRQNYRHCNAYGFWTRGAIKW